MGDDVFLDAGAATFRHAAERHILSRRQRRRRRLVASVVLAVMLLPAGGALAVQELDQWDSLTVSTVVGFGDDTVVIDVQPGADPIRVADDLRAFFRGRGWDVEVDTLAGADSMAGTLVVEDGVRLDQSLPAPYTRRVRLGAGSGAVRVVVPAADGSLYDAVAPVGGACGFLGLPSGEVAQVLGAAGTDLRWQDSSGAPADPDERPVVALLEIGPGQLLGVLSATVEPLPCS